MVNTTNISKRAASLTVEEKRRIAHAWRMEVGGADAAIAARRVAIEHKRDAALRAHRELTTEIARQTTEPGTKEEWNEVCAMQAVNEAVLADSIADLAPTYIRPRDLEILLHPWRSVIGE